MTNHGARKWRRPRKKVKKRDQQSSGTIIIRDGPILPDDLIINIISRFSAKDAVKFRCVGKKYRDLITSPYFINLHIKRSSHCTVPMILVMNGPHSRQQFLLDRFWESELKILEIHKSCCFYPDYSMKLSLDGLIVSKNHNSPGNFIVFNPLYSEKVTITVPSKPQSEIFGVFYKACTEEYCTIWEMTVSSRPFIVQYKMLNLGSEPYWRDIKNPWTQNGRIQDIKPVLVNEYLYWAVEPEPYFRDEIQDFREATYIIDIMEFNTITEGFEMMHCPVPVDFYGCECNITLLNVNGLLVLVQVSRNESQIAISIWTLKDRADKIWTSSEYSMRNCFGYMAKALAIWNEEVVLQAYQRLFVCNLRQRTTRGIGKALYQRTASFTSHMMSVASLKSCKSEIRMMEDDKNGPKSVWSKRLRRMKTDRSNSEEAP